MSEQNFELRRSRNFSDILSAVFDLLRIVALPLTKSVVFIAGPYAVIAALGAAFSNADLLDMQAGMFAGSDTPFDMFNFGLPLLISSILFLVAYVMQAAAVYSFYKFFDREGRSPTVDEVRAEMTGTLGTVVTTMILQIIILFFGFIFLIIPGIYLFVPTSFLIIILLNEGGSFGDAFSRSFKLINDRWWWTFGLIVVAYVATSVLGSIFGIPAALLALSTSFVSIDGDAPLWLAVITGFFTVIARLAEFILGTVVLTAVAVLYYNHVERIDATDLTARIQGLGEDSDIPPPPSYGR